MRNGWTYQVDKSGMFRFARMAMIVLLGDTFVAGCASTPDEGATTMEADDQVRIGYGTQARSEVTGSVASVTAEDVAGQDVVSIEDMINGRVAGLHAVRLPNGGLSLRIRGRNTILGSSEPLVVIDGMPIHGNPGTALMALNPSEIRRIDVLKDAGSTAIYGSRGANGVVLITTDRAP